MHNFKKVLCSIICILLVFLVISAAVIVPYLHSEMFYYQDHKLRESLAGTLDFITIGASNGLCAFDPRIIDSELEATSYNLSGTLMTLGARDFFLKKEIQRNPVKTVVMDVSYETLVRDETDESASGDAVSLARLLSARDRGSFILKTVHFSDWLNLYAQMFIPGLEHLDAVIHDSVIRRVNYDTKGFYSREATDIAFSSEQAAQQYNQYDLDTNFREGNIEKLVSQIKYCQDQNIKVILTVVPKSDRDLWQTNHHDAFYQWMIEFSREQGCDFYDFNLLRNRYELWNDRESFYDSTHMGGEGAASFTQVFCDILKKAETEDVSEYFYDSYEQMKADSPYMAYLK